MGVSGSTDAHGCLTDLGEGENLVRRMGSVSSSDTGPIGFGAHYSTVSMQQEALIQMFDRQAQSYDQQWNDLAPINSTLHLLTESVLSGLPSTAHILCVGAGTGAEILHLAQRFPTWKFTAVEPSVQMLNVFRDKAEKHGIRSRCVFHSGYLDSLPVREGFDAATAFLVSQFILDRKARAAFFQGIARRLLPGGFLVSSDLSSDLETTGGQSLLELWFKVMSRGGSSDDGIRRMRDAYVRDVAVLPSREVEEMMADGGFEPPTLFYQAGMIRAWYAKRSSS